jgi:hypothetical protein
LESTVAKKPQSLIRTVSPANFRGLAIADDCEAFLNARGRAANLQSELNEWLEGSPVAIDGVDDAFEELCRLRNENTAAAKAASRRIARAVLKLHKIDGSRPWEDSGAWVGAAPFSYLILISPGEMLRLYYVETSFAIDDARVAVAHHHGVIDCRLKHPSSQPTPETTEDIPDER